jgi:cholesterol 25-hydroxylase
MSAAWNENALQPLWELVVEQCPLTRHWLFAGWLTLASYIIFCVYFTWKDVFRHHSKLDTDYWPSSEDMVRAALPQLVVYFGLDSLFTYLYPELSTLPERAPTLLQFLGEVCVSFVAGDFFIYWEHRVMHIIPYLRTHIHSVHHDYHSCFSWAGGWVHPAEDVVVILCQITVPLLCGFHPLSLWTFTFWWVAFLVEEHSGHDVWWAPHHWLPFSMGGGATPHLPHHMYPAKNFGFVLLVWDHLFGTYAAPTTPLVKPKHYRSWWEYAEQPKKIVDQHKQE